MKGLSFNPKYSVLNCKIQAKDKNLICEQPLVKVETNGNINIVIYLQWSIYKTLFYSFAGFYTAIKNFRNKKFQD